MSYYGGSSRHSSPYVPYDHPAPGYSGDVKSPSSSASSERPRGRSMSRSMSTFTSPPPGSRPSSAGPGGGSPYGFMGSSGSPYGGSGYGGSPYSGSSGGSYYSGSSVSSGSIDYSGYRNMYGGSPFGSPAPYTYGGSRRNSLSGGSSHSSPAYGDDIFGAGRWRRAGAPSPDRGIGGGIFAPNYTPHSFASGSMTENASAYGGMPTYGLSGPSSEGTRRARGPGKNKGPFQGFKTNITPGTFEKKRARDPSSSPDYDGRRSRR